jgi:hypothetical protein
MEIEPERQENTRHELTKELVEASLRFLASVTALESRISKNCV